MAANIRQELSGIDLQDERRNRRVALLASRMAAAPSSSLRASNRGWDEAMGAFRLLHNKEVTPERILEPHWRSTLERASQCKRLLLIQDTTEFEYTSHEALQGVGRLDHEHRRGFYAHNLLLADEDSEVALGLCGMKLWTRGPKSERRDWTKRPLETKETYRWMEGYLKACAVAEACPQAQVLSLGDRESDIGEIYLEWQRRRVQNEVCADFLIRASRDRTLFQEEGGSLFAAIRQTPVLGCYDLVVKDEQLFRKIHGNTRQVHRKARIAKMQVRSRRVHIQLAARSNREVPPPVCLTAIGVFEENPPAGEPPLEWILLTSLPVESFEQAERLIAAYCNRWLIEDYHRILKSGCKVEEIQLRDSQALLPALALYGIVAWRILHLRDFGRVEPALCSSLFFSTAHWQAASLMANGKMAATAPSMPEMIKMIAKLGGYMGRKSDPNPGAQCLWVGLQKLDAYVEMGLALGKLAAEDQ